MANHTFDFSALPSPKVIEPISYETLLEERKARLIELAPAYEAVLQLESEPLVIALQLESYREYMLRQRINEALKSNLLAMAQGSDLDHLGVFYGVLRSKGELDLNYRNRIKDRTIASSTAGSKEHYRSRAIAVAPTQIKDVEVESPLDPFDPTRNKGLVRIAVLVKYSILEQQRSMLQPSLSHQTAQAIKSLQVDFQAVVSDLIDAPVDTRQAESARLLAEIVSRVRQAVSADDVKVLTDTLEVVPAQLVPVAVEADIYLQEDTPELVFDHLINQLIRNWELNLALGLDIAPSWLHTQLHRDGIRHVDLKIPNQLKHINSNQCAIPSTVKLTLFR